MNELEKLRVLIPNWIEHNEELGDTHVKQFETDVVLRDGSLVHVRPVRSEDRAFLARFIETLSTETLYLRFLHALKPEEAVKELMPGAGQFALLAVREEMVIGHAIYSETLSGKAKPAVVVADAYQGKGLGTILLGQLTQAAIRDCGHRCFAPARWHQRRALPKYFRGWIPGASLSSER
ncbi:MAG: GNAT family N-acetyltransferase [Anaerolineales bacterium]